VPDATSKVPALVPVLSATPQGDAVMTKKVWQAPKVETTPVSMEVTMYLPAQA
jgi:coenzyme PQQ precursor peptide PqqA